MKRNNKPRMSDPPFDDDHGKRNKDYELGACTGTGCLSWEGVAAQLVDVLVKIKADITAVQEMRCTGQGQIRVGPCGIYYSGHIKERQFSVGFVVGERLRPRILSFTPVNERLTIRITASLFNISLICAHAPKEEKDDVTKDAFYECLGPLIRAARVGKEGIFGTTVGKFSLHDETSPNVLRLIDSAGIRNMVICSTRFQHKKIKLPGCLKNACQQTLGRFDVGKLQSQQTIERFSTRLALLLSESTRQQLGIKELLDGISNTLRIAATETIGFRKMQKNMRSAVSQRRENRLPTSQRYDRPQHVRDGIHTES
ncbi:uncharacterized protein LOC125776690 [Bactrocera dorsalis]|uniref:Uncharacterized protein LOC125776690 n=1 Tax=Bactrocera dorsalis TaxID=27457 RepID=A0ABM3JAB7_BACDO|nr:uncharacterized protein LOC125776690 [Bactrocera dorsalis]XP_049306177.1 uncharacterized protein LOC125776690 [Bactrocera dorsalis]